MYSGTGTRALPRVSFLIRRSPDQRSVSTSPGLIAAAHVLHRLLAPRHPPCALILLIRKNTCCRYGVFKVRASSSPALLEPEQSRTRRSRLLCDSARSLKAQQRAVLSPANRFERYIGRRVLGETETGRAQAPAALAVSGVVRADRARAHQQARIRKSGCLPNGTDASGVIAPDSLERR